MIAAWMLYALAIGVVASAAGLVLERAALARGRAVRPVWIALMALSVLWPLAMFARSYAAPPASSPMAQSATFAPLNVVDEPTGMVGVLVARTPRALTNTMVMAGWATLSALFALRLLVAGALLARRRRAWDRQTVDGVTVRMSADAGPAVVGLHPMEVVLPRWMLGLDPALRALVLLHEQEHRRARDPYVLVAAALLVVLMPWNVALLWQARRLRLALELDCDTRVLRAQPDVERYGALLIAIAQRRGVGARPFAMGTAISPSTRTLSRRISAMQPRPTKVSGVRLALYGAAVAVLVVAACAVDAPDGPLSTSPVGAAPPLERATAGISLAVETAPVLDTRSARGAVLIPADAVITRDLRPLVFVVREGRAQWTYIVRGANHGAFTEVLPDTSGARRGIPAVSAGDEVIVAGHLTLTHDAPVHQVERRARPEPSAR